MDVLEAIRGPTDLGPAQRKNEEKDGSGIQNERFRLYRFSFISALVRCAVHTERGFALFKQRERTFGLWQMVLIKKDEKTSWEGPSNGFPNSTIWKKARACTEDKIKRRQKTCQSPELYCVSQFPHLGPKRLGHLAELFCSSPQMLRHLAFRPRKRDGYSKKW